MADYKSMYHTAFNAITDAGRLVSQASDILKRAQAETEEQYLSAPDPKILLLDATKNEEGEKDKK